MVNAEELAIVHVIWADAHCDEAGWISTDMDDDGECLVSTVGFLVPVGHGGKKDHVTVWQSLCDDEGIGRFHIPVDMVRNLDILRSAKPRK